MPPVGPRRSAEPRRSGSLLAWALTIVVIASLAWAGRLLIDTGGPDVVAPEPAASPADARQRELLEQDVDRVGDPHLMRVFQDLNARHFEGRLPPMPVLWEPRLAEVGALVGEAFTLEGMFGHVGDKAIILLNAQIGGDEAALLRVLSHEMVHAFLYTLGEDSSDHGSLFQAELRRLSIEGAFTGIVASDEERRRLRAWLEQESARLDESHEALAREHDAIEAERAALDEARRAIEAAAASAETRTRIADFNARLETFNRRVEEANARTARGRGDVAEFNRQVERYDLMLAYPDGLAHGDRVSRR